MKLEGRVCLVTGGARRVGSRIACALGARGAAVVVHYHRSEADARRTADAIVAAGGRAAIVEADLSKHDQVLALAARSAEPFGRVEVLVNNASVFSASAFDRFDGADWDRNMDINLKAPAFLARDLGLAMRAAGEGKIVNIGDGTGIRHEGYLPYVISKAALDALTRALARELAPEVQVNAVRPGPVLPPEQLDEAGVRGIIARTPLARLGSPSDVVAGVLFFVEGTDFATGSVLDVDGGRGIS